MQENDVDSPGAEQIEFDQSRWEKVVSGELTIFDFYKTQRERCPVSYTRGTDGSGIWHVFKATDVADVLRNTGLFSSVGEVARFGQRMIPIECDPPEHGEYRRLLSSLMSPRRLKQYEDNVRVRIASELDAIIAEGGGNMSDLTYRISFGTFCMLLGEEDASFKEADDKRASSAPTIQKMDAESVAKRLELNTPLRDFCLNRLRLCREQPNDTLASDIANGEVNGRLLTEDEAVSILNLLYMAGYRSTAGGMQAVIIALANSPELQNTLRASPRDIPLAVEEALRLESPVQSLPRHATQDLVLGGRHIKAGDQVCPVYASANLDPDEFADAGTFDLQRRPQHFTFGKGIHQCAGAQLARMQMKVMVEELLARTSAIALRHPPVRRPWPHNQSTELDVALTAVSS